VPVGPRADLLEYVEASEDVALDESGMVLRHIKLNYGSPKSQLLQIPSPPPPNTILDNPHPPIMAATDEI
jgi:hypothetical protein